LQAYAHATTYAAVLSVFAVYTAVLLQFVALLLVEYLDLGLLRVVGVAPILGTCDFSHGGSRHLLQLSVDHEVVWVVGGLDRTETTSSLAALGLSA